MIPYLFKDREVPQLQERPPITILEKLRNVFRKTKRTSIHNDDSLNEALVVNSQTKPEIESNTDKNQYVTLANTDINVLRFVEYKDTTLFYPDIKYCKCIKVYDGDTITIATLMKGDSPQKIYRFSVRLFGIDAPEIKGQNNTEKMLARKTRDALSAKILGKIIRLQCMNVAEKWGRVLAKVYLNEEDICQWLLDNRLAVSYEGKTKIRPAEWDEPETL